MVNAHSARRMLLAATVSLIATSAAEAAPAFAEDASMIVPRADLANNQPPPSGVLDLGVTGVGQVISDAGGGFIGTCTGSLINPRAVIFAAHCVNTRPADAYGGNQGGTGIGVFFNDFTLAGVRRWLGLDGGTRFASDTSRNYFNGNQLWYDTRSLALGPSLNFLQADVAILTLDTHAGDIPTWAMLFSPLTEETHVSLVGYGNTGNGVVGANASGGFRRRAVENMLSFLGSLDDRNDFLFGPAAPFLVQSLYNTDFDDPRRGTGTESIYDFDLFDGDALPREGTTAPGDSGGPLIVDELFDRDVIAGVLSGGSRFFGPQVFSSYGTQSFYQPLFLFWDVIVQNNPYVYASAKAGDGDWFDPTHWVQDMDPNYTVIRNGALVNGLPDTPALGVSGETTKFGKVCFFDICQDIGEESIGVPQGDGQSLVIAGGPGSTNFVPNNIEPDRLTGRKARYYDVTLSREGTTSLGQAATIDKLTIAGKAKLDVKSGGDLKVWGDFTQTSGWTNVDGRITAGETLFLTGILSGSGTLKAPWVTVGAVTVAPAGADSIGTLTIDGNMILSSGAALFVDANRFGADKLAVTGSLDINGSALVMNKAKGAAPRHGDAFQIVSAGALTGSFGDIYSFQGVLRPELSYTGTGVTATLRAGSLANQIGQSGPVERAFAQALDTLRSGSYNALYNLYGTIDLMGSAQLASTLRGLAPVGVADSLQMHDRQSRLLLSTISDRLGMVGRSSGQGFEVMGAPQALALTLATQGGANVRAAQMGLAHGLVPGADPRLGTLPEGVSGFVSGGFNEAAAAGSAFGGQERMAHMAMGLEFEVADGLTIGSAVAHAEGLTDIETRATDSARTRMSQAAFYGTYRMGGGVYVAGLAAAETGAVDTRRSVATGDRTLDLMGATSTQRLTLMAETGVAFGVMDGLELMPKAQLAWSQNRYGGLDERGGDAALALDTLQLERVEARLGLAAVGSMKVGRGWSLTPRLQAQAVRLLAGADSGMTVRFAAARDVGIALPLLSGDSSWAEVKSGVSLTKGNLSFGAGVESSIGRADLQDSRAIAEFGFRF